MEIIFTYRTEIDEKLKNILVQEQCYSYETNIGDSPARIVKMMNQLFRMDKLAEEYVYMLALNTRCNIIGIFEISHGNVDGSIYKPREVIIRALLCGASGIILVHNHPGKTTNPSESDIKVMRRMREACDLVGIVLFDSIIIGNDYYSFKENERIEIIG